MVTLAVTTLTSYHPPLFKTIGFDMLQQLRAASKSWVASVIIGILVLAFALWGVADIFHGGNDDVVADVGGAEISADQYDVEMKNQMREVSDQTKTQITLDQAKAMGLDKNVLQNAISRTALDEVGRRMGLVASQESVAAQIRNSNAFRGTDGAFDPNRFQQTLQQSGLSEAAFVASTRQDIARGQLINAAVDGMAAPPGLTRLLYDYVNEERIATYLVVTPAEAGQVPEPTADQLQAYYKAHAAAFSAPEYRAIDYTQIGQDQVAGDIKISDADLKGEYDAHKAEYQKPEQRDVEQISFPTKEAADMAAQKIKTAADFASAVHERGLKDEDVKLGTFAAAGLDPRLSKAVFAVPEGGVTAPVQGPFGWVILRAAKVVPGESKTMDDVKDQLKDALVKTRASAKIAELANSLEDARGGGANLAAAAKKLNIPLHHVASIDRMGMTPEGTKAEIPASPQFLDQVFQTESGEESDAFQSEDGDSFVVKVDSVTPPTVKPFDAVREQVKDGFVAEARAKLLQAKVQALTQEAKTAGNLAGIGKTLGHAPVVSMALKRGQMDDVFSAQLGGELFATPPGTVISGAAGKGDGYVIAQITQVTHPAPDVSAASYATFRQTASQQLGETAVDTLAAAARQNARVNIHEATVQRVLGGAAQ
jgi:peptidyl-prolyl cis-trans isomerase D